MDNKKKNEERLEELRKFYESYRAAKQEPSEPRKATRQFTLDDRIRDVNPYFEIEVMTFNG